MEYLLFNDILGPEIKMKIKGESTLKSKLGALLSFILIVLIVLVFVGFVRDIFEKKEPTIVFNRVHTYNTLFQFYSNLVFLF
jgi:hypothetical protein